ncbi:hypothetical protein pdam_00006664 [Pocillopora damicornis]|uniref:Uncharacterized protein n=1 Tax=Pocillopora damicornis TaxID=46731 RepID=A0A3M6TKL0_POCDA|nr:hypothetical protein pdam_00006664 [Pocillopora damicornis]
MESTCENQSALQLKSFLKPGATYIALLEHLVIQVKLKLKAQLENDSSQDCSNGGIWSSAKPSIKSPKCAWFEEGNNDRPILKVKFHTKGTLPKGLKLTFVSSLMLKIKQHPKDYSYIEIGNQRNGVCKGDTYGNPDKKPDPESLTAAACVMIGGQGLIIDTNVSCKFYTPTHSRYMSNIPVCKEFLPNRPHHESMGYAALLQAYDVLANHGHPHQYDSKRRRKLFARRMNKLKKTNRPK